MPIPVTCGACGKAFNVADDLAGRRVKCPACQQIVAVPGGAAAADVEDEPAEAAPRKAKKPAGSNKQLMLWGGIAGGVVLLLSCCCLGGGLLWFLVLRGPGDPEKVVIGKWKYDGEIVGGQFANTGYTVEFKEDGTYSKTFNPPGPSSNPGRWSASNKEGGSMTVQASYEAVFPTFRTTQNERYDITVVDNNTLELKPNRKQMYGARLKRI